MLEDSRRDDSVGGTVGAVSLGPAVAVCCSPAASPFIDIAIANASISSSLRSCSGSAAGCVVAVGAGCVATCGIGMVGIEIVGRRGT